MHEDSNNAALRNLVNATDGKTSLLIMREQEWRELYTLIQKTNSMLGKIEEKVANHDNILNHPANGVVVRINEMERAMSDKFHVIELQMTRQLAEIKANEENRYNQFKEIFTAQRQIQDDKVFERFNTLVSNITSKQETLEKRLAPLEEKRIASWASWQTLVIICVVIGEILNLIFNYFQGANQHIGQTAEKTITFVSYIQQLFC